MESSRTPRYVSVAPTLLLTLALLVGLLSLVPTATAAPFPAIPPGLHPGDQYRMIFATSSLTTAISKNIDDYNAFVQANANSGPLASLGTTWKIVGSTAAVAASLNTLTRPGTDPSVPIYNVNGDLIATGYADWWDGSPTRTDIRSADNSSQSGVNIWTGTAPDGSVDSPLGNITPVTFGVDNSVTKWVQFGTQVPTNSFPAYGISDVLTVPPAPTSTITATRSVTATPSITSTPSSTPTITPTATSTATASPTPSATASLTLTPSPSATPTATPQLTAPPSGTPTVTATASATPISGFNGPNGLAFDHAGNLYVSNTGDGTISKITPGGVVTQFANGFSSPFGLAFDRNGVNLYVANAGDNTVSKVTPDGTVTLFASGFFIPKGLAFDSTGVLHVTDFTGKVYRVSADGQTVTPFVTSGVDDPNLIAFDSADNLYVPLLTEGTVQKVTPSGQVSLFASGFTGPVAVAFDAAGTLFVTSQSDGTVKQVSPAGVVSPVSSGFNIPRGLAFDSAGSLYVVNNGSGTISKLTFAPTPTPTTTPSITPTVPAASGSATATPTPSPSRTPTGTATVTPTQNGQSGSTLQGQVAYQGRGTPPQTNWEQEVQVTLFQAGTANVRLRATPATTTSGSFSIPVPTPGSYDVRVKHRPALSVQRNGVSFPAGIPVGLDFGVLPTGDGNGDDQIDIVDFSLLRAVFGTAQTCGSVISNPLPCADFDGNGQVDIVDFSLLRANFGRVGPILLS